jgi:hypothetical protein
MSAAGSWPGLALGTLALLVAAVSGQAVAAAVDSPRLDHVTCQGLRIRQTGLPASTALVIGIADPESGREFTRQEARSNGAGVLDTRIAARFDGASELAVEVEVERGGQEVEFAEAIHEFDRPCPAAQAGSSTGRRTGAATAAATAVVLVLVAAGGAIYLVRRRVSR